MSKIATACLICGGAVPVWFHCDTPKICDKCKAAVMKVRAEIEKGENNGQVDTEPCTMVVDEPQR